jgi:hypothetical protein
MIDAEETWQQWPVCPSCRQRRHAVCPACQSVADDLPLASYAPDPAPLEPTRPGAGTCGSGCCQGMPVSLGDASAAVAGGSDEAGTEAPILLLCTQCDEVFPPSFYRECQRCGHDFGEGVPAPLDDAGANLRPVLVLFGMLALAAVILGYCWYLFQQ